jgi:hypothetical protein
MRRVREQSMRFALKRSHSFPVPAALGLAVAALLFSNNLRAQNKDDAPRIDRKAGDEILVLPERLKETIHSLLPAFHVPESSDRKGLWAKDTEAGNLPYAVWGNLSGGGRTDVALILLGDKEWKLAIFHQTDTGYVLAYAQGSKTVGPEAQVSSPQVLSLSLIPKGKPYVYTTIGAPADKSEKEFTFQTDAMEFTATEQFLTLVYWKNGKYNFIDFTD